MHIYFYVVFFSLLTVGCHPGFSQAQKGKAKNLGISEWMLSTGDWQNDPKIYVRTIGRGPDTVVVLHGGWGGEHRQMIDVTRGLEEKYFFVLYDQRGSLRSPCPDSLISFDKHIADLEMLRKDLRLNTLTIAAHSMGAVLACAYLQKFPDRVENLVLLAPAYLKAPFPDDDGDLIRQSGAASQEFMRRQAVVDELNKWSLQRETPPLSSLEKTARDRILYGSRFLFDIRKWQELKGGGVFYNPKISFLTNQTLPAEGWNYPETIKKARVSTTIIAGDHDFLDMGAKIVQKWVKGIPNIKFHLIKDAGHEIWIDQPTKFKQTFDQALRK